MFQRGFFPFVLLCLSLFGSGIYAETASVSSTEVYFSPEDHVDVRLIAMIEKEKQGIQAAVYCLMHRGIAKALNEAKARGVSVEVIVDPFSVTARSPLEKMVEKGLEIFIWNAQAVKEQEAAHKKHKGRKALMHDKFCVFGDHSVWTGSFNFTNDGAHINRENVVILHDPALVARYKREFQKIKQEGCISYRNFLEAKMQKKSLATK